MPGLMEWLMGSKEKFKKLPMFDPMQQNVYGQMGQSAMGGEMYGQGGAGYKSGMGYLQDLYSQSPQSFARMQEPYMRNFQQQVVPGLAERFSAAGGGSPMGGGRQSSSFNQAMGQAGSNLSSQLGGMFEQMRSQNLSNLLSFSQAPFNQAMQMMNLKPFGYVHQPGQSGMMGPLLSSLGAATMGPIGEAIGQGAGSGISNWFNSGQQDGQGQQGMPSDYFSSGGYNPYQNYGRMTGMGY